jgi:hypothetical protein
MRRKVTIKANDGRSRVEVTITADCARTLTPDESKSVVDDLADDVMRALPGVRYTDFRLNSIRVR